MEFLGIHNGNGTNTWKKTTHSKLITIYHTRLHYYVQQTAREMGMEATLNILPNYGERMHVRIHQEDGKEIRYGTIDLDTMRAYCIGKIDPDFPIKKIYRDLNLDFVIENLSKSAIIERCLEISQHITIKSLKNFVFRPNVGSLELQIPIDFAKWYDSGRLLKSLLEL